MKKFSIIIPNYNGRVLLEKNLPRVKKAALTSGFECEVIVVDDGSRDTSVDFLRKDFPDIRIVVLKKNSGFGKAINAAVSRAEGEILVLLNNDIVPQKNFLKPLLSHFSESRKGEIFAVSCLQEVVEEEDSFLGGGAAGRFIHGFLKHESIFKNTKPGSQLLYSFYASGGAAAFNREKFLQLNGLDEIFSPFYFEDADISMRAWKRGWKTLVDPKSRVLHNHQSTVTLEFSKFFRKTVGQRNFILFTWRHIEGARMLLLHLFWLPFYFIRSVLRFDLYFLSGFLWAILFLPQIMSRRIKDQRENEKGNFKYNVSEILNFSQNHE
ncbi:glycosyltransferase family 2 protein [Candidatus Berkelbacteria bacterium]|nr:glycosyltransferase family 2 protein [Candidatus Berkelbacteria bacterium]